MIDNYSVDQLEDELEYLRTLVRYIATDYVELSYDKVFLQRNDYMRAARKICEKFDITTANLAIIVEVVHS